MGLHYKIFDCFTVIYKHSTGYKDRFELENQRVSRCHCFRVILSEALLTSTQIPSALAFACANKRSQKLNVEVDIKCCLETSTTPLQSQSNGRQYNEGTASVLRY